MFVLPVGTGITPIVLHEIDNHLVVKTAGIKETLGMILR